MIRHEQRVGLMNRDWHPFEARMAPMLNAIGLHFATEGFTPANRGHAKTFWPGGTSRGQIILRTRLKLSGRSCCPLRTRNTALPLRPPPLRGKLRQARSLSACIGAAGTICCRRTRPCRSARRSITPPPAARCAKACPRRNCLSFQTTPPMCGSIWTLRACRCITAPGQKCRGGPCPDAPLPGVCAEQLHFQLVGAVAGRCAGPLCDRAGPLVRQRQKDRPV